MGLDERAASKMMIDIWMHWFWITILMGSFPGREPFASSYVAEAGLPDARHGALTYILDASHDARRLKRTVEDEDESDEATTTMTTTSTIAATTTATTTTTTTNTTTATTMAAAAAPTTTVNDTASSSGESTGRDDASLASSELYHGASDSDDTYNSGDGFQYPLKKYTKYVKYKLKLKPRENGTTESSAAEGNASAENVTVVVVTVAANETDAPENRTTEESVAVVTDAGDVAPTEPPVDPRPNDTDLTAESKLEESVFVRTTVEPFVFDNRVAAATSAESRERLSQPSLDAGSITGITLGIVVISGFIGAVSFVLYRRRYLNKPQALNDKSSNLDSSGYIDDTSLRENSEEMYSLDNDSFLNSLEAMTIQNYWTENVKHTKL